MSNLNQVLLRGRAALGQPPPASGHGMPPIPLAPVLSGAAFGHRGHDAVPSVLDAGTVRHVTSGRVAIALALRQMGVGSGDEVLVPAYHCASMVEPVTWSGARPVFYRIGADTAADMADMASRLTPATRVLMATNYFGFPQPLDRLRAFCDQHGLLLLEDCAHSFLGAYGGRPLGAWGDYAIASSMKFYPVHEGGCLVSAHHPLSAVTLVSAGAGFEAKAAINTLEHSCTHGRLGALRWLLAAPLALKTMLWSQIKVHAPARARPLTPASSEGGFGFDPAWLDKRASLFTRLMLRTVSRRRMGALRRRHYLRLHDALVEVAGCRPLRATLPDGVYPWVFPLWVDQPQPVFLALKAMAVPVLRFGEYLSPDVTADTCPNSIALSRHVLQFPCHQELRAQELDWLIDRVRAAVITATIKAGP